VAAVRGRVVEALGREAFLETLVMDPKPKGKTTLVFGDGAGYGFLPHVHARNQEAIMARAGIDAELGVCVAFSTN
jgi:hypothetical protein